MMKTILSIIFSSIFLLTSQFSNAQHIKYFTKADASKWIYILKDKSIEPTEVFKMNDGKLQITGVSTGYLRTKKMYKNFTLKLDWRWTKVLGNSGVLVHIQPKDSIWPVCYQIQQKANAAGDIICMNGLWAKECTDTVKTTVLKQNPSNEKPMGEWNSMEIISKNGTLKVIVNGEIQNYITGLTAKKGYIGFQNEGKPVEFKNLILKKQ